MKYGRPNREEFGHVRAYGQDFKGRLEAAGFVVSYSDGELFEVSKAGCDISTPADRPIWAGTPIEGKKRDL